MGTIKEAFWRNKLIEQTIGHKPQELSMVIAILRLYVENIDFINNKQKLE